MRTDQHLSESKMLSQVLVSQACSNSPKHTPPHPINAVTVGVLYTAKSYFPRNKATKDKFSLKSCVIFVTSMVQKRVMLRVRVWVFSVCLKPESEGVFGLI